MSYHYNDPNYGTKQRLKGAITFLPVLIVLGLLISLYENWEIVISYLKSILNIS